MGFFRIRRLKSTLLFLAMLLTVTSWLEMTVLPGSSSLEGTQQSVKLTSDQLMEQEQNERKQRLQTFCESNRKDSLQTPATALNLRHITVNDKFKTLYCYIPKVACSLWKTVFVALDNNSNVEDVHDRKHLKFLNQYSEDEIRFRLQTYFKFLFVREPFERLLSGYKDKFANNFWNWVDNPRYTKAILKNYKREDPTADDKVTLRKFISYVINEEDRNEHWDTFNKLCHPCAIKYDFIGHFETLNEEAPYVLRKTGMDHVTAFPTIESHNTSNKLRDTFAEVPSGKIVELGQVFQDDFEMFNYPFPGPLSDRMRDFK